MPQSQKFSRSVIIPNTKGLHARASAAFVKKAEEFSCSVEVQREQEIADGTSILDLLILAASKGTEITIICQGQGSEKALESLVNLVSMGFYEDED